MTRQEFRDAVFKRRPELRGKLWCNKGDTVTVRGVMTYYWLNLDRDIESEVHHFLAELDDLRTENAELKSFAIEFIHRAEPNTRSR